MPIGLADSTRFNTFCTAVQALVAIATVFCATAAAAVATLFLITAAVETANALTLAYTVVVRVFRPAVRVVMLERAVIVEDAIITNGIAPLARAPSCSLISPILLANCACLPLSVAANWAFISPTLLVITCARTAARSLSVPYFSTCASASLKVIPTRVRADTWPCIALPIRLATLTASVVLELTPCCWANKLFIAGSRVSMLLFSLRKVATCWAPASCTSSPTTPNFCCSLASCLMLSISASVAFIRCRITVVSCVSTISCCW